MSKYTTELRYVLESYAGLDESADGDKVEQIIASALPKLFDFTLPLFDANYVTALETKICRHYYTREIGYETVGRFKLGLKTKLIEILPYYNKLYESELLKLNPLSNYSVKRQGNDTSGNKRVSEGDFSRTDEGNESSTSTSANKGKNVRSNKERFSDTPNGTLADVENNTYLTNATIVDTADSTKNEGTSANNVSNKNVMRGGNSNVDTFTSNNAYIEYVAGVNGISESKLLKQYRDTFLNIDMMIIEELEPLFMQLW